MLYYPFVVAAGLLTLGVHDKEMAYLLTQTERHAGQHDEALEPGGDLRKGIGLRAAW